MRRFDDTKDDNGNAKSTVYSTQYRYIRIYEGKGVIGGINVGPSGISTAGRRKPRAIPNNRLNAA